MKARGQTWPDDDRDIPSREIVGELTTEYVPVLGKTKYLINGRGVDPATVEEITENANPEGCNQYKECSSDHVKHVTGIVRHLAGEDNLTTVHAVQKASSLNLEDFRKALKQAWRDGHISLRAYEGFQKEPKHVMEAGLLNPDDPSAPYVYVSRRGE